MSKKQVILVSFAAALPAMGLLAALVMSGLDHGTEFSGPIWAIVAVAFVLVLVLSASPFVLMALYPTDGFAALGPAIPAPAPGAPPAESDDDFDDDETFEDEGDDFEDDGFEDDGDEELFDDDDGGFDDFEDDDEWN